MAGHKYLKKRGFGHINGLSSGGAGSHLDNEYYKQPYTSSTMVLTHMTGSPLVQPMVASEIPSLVWNENWLLSSSKTQSNDWLGA